VNKVKLWYFECYFVNYLQSTFLINAFEIVTVLLHTVVFFCVFLLISDTVTLFLIIFGNWETFTVNFGVDTEQPLAISGSSEAV